MRTLGNILRILRRESPLTLAREAGWKFTCRWRRRQLGRLLGTKPTLWFRPVPYYQPNIEQISEEQRQLLIDMADGICQGRIPFLSYGTQELGLTPAWNTDFVSQKEWPLEPSHLLPVVRFDGSDIKVPWELSRLQFLPTLGKAYCLTHKTGYRQAALHFVDDWINRNPVGQGANWMVAMEVSLRALSILFLLNLLWPIADGEKEWAEKVTASLWQHLLYIEANMEFSHIARGNHYLSNLVGLYGLAVFLEGTGMQERRRRYQRLLQSEILLHVYEDGGNYEASTGYHVLVTQIFLTAHQLMRADGAVPAQGFRDRLRKMFVWMDTLADCSGRLPHIGDCDDGRIEVLFDDLKQMASLPVIARDSLRVASLLGLGAALVNAGTGGSPADALWFGAQAGTTHDMSRNASTLPKVQTVLPQSGMAVTSSGCNDLLLMALPNGIHGKGSHTHNDKLSVILRIEGEEVLCDPGTGCYTRDGEVRNRFRSTAAHNTVTVDREEQNRLPTGRMGFFSLGNEAHVSQIESAHSTCRVSASHFGYSDRGIVHSRSVQWISNNQLHIEDAFSGKGRHGLVMHFQVAPGWRVLIAGPEGRDVTCILEGRRRINMTFRAEEKVRVAHMPGAVSWVFGTSLPSSSLRVTLNVELPTTFMTNIFWNE